MKSEIKGISRKGKIDSRWKANAELPKLIVLEQGVKLNHTINKFLTPADCFKLCFDGSMLKL